MFKLLAFPHIVSVALVDSLLTAQHFQLYPVGSEVAICPVRGR